MHNVRLIRLSVALVWLYQGLWSKLLGPAEDHAAIIAAVPFLDPAQAHRVLILIGVVECGIAVWVLSGWRPREGAFLQTGLLLGMNAAGVVWGSSMIPDPVGMLLQNFAFLLLAWVGVGERHVVATRSAQR